MDYHLPGMSGLEALKEIHHVRGLDLPVILITGHGTEEIALQSLKLGACDYIIKSQNYLHHLPYSVENAFFRINAQRERLALVQREKEFHTLANNLPSIVWRCDRALRTLYVNPAVESAFGLPSSVFFGRTLTEAGLPPAQSTAWQDAIQKVFETGDEQRSEFKSHSPAGLKDWGARIVPERTPDGSIESVLLIAHDITERKQSELAVEQSEKRFRSLIENGSDLITVVNGKGVIQFQSSSSLRVLGFTPSEMTGHRSFDFIHPEDIPRMAEAIQGAVLYPASPFTVQYRFRDCNDSWRFFESVGRNIPSESPDGFIVLNSRDITDTRKLEEQFRQAQKMEAIGQLSGGVAHDFNNILTVIQGHASLLQLEENISPSARESADEILLASERAANLTRQLLTFSRRQAMQPRDLDLNEVVSNMTKMFQRLLGEDIQIQINYDSKRLNVHADSGMLEQILLNLAVNSRDAMPKGGRLIIETSAVDFEEVSGLPSTAARCGSFVCLTVSDTGAGIPKGILSRIFEPFFTTKAVGQGTGLGLATVYGIVQQHQGWLTVYSEENLGTTFRIYLPRAIIKGEGPSATPVLDSVRGGDETILLVEDEPSLRILVRNVLSKLGYRILEASTGASALTVWKQNRDEIKLVMTDLVMPDGMTGIELGRRLGEEDPNMKIIYTSGYSAEIAGKDFLLIEGKNFIAKPFAPRKLAQAVRARLDG